MQWTVGVNINNPVAPRHVSHEVVLHNIYGRPKAFSIPRGAVYSLQILLHGWSGPQLALLEAGITLKIWQ